MPGWQQTRFRCLLHSKYTTPKQWRNGGDIREPGLATPWRPGLARKLSVIGEEAREVFYTLEWEHEGDDAKIEAALTKFEQYCLPRKSVPFERYRFNQEPGETYDQYRTAMRKIAENCDFDEITPDQILRDRPVFGICDTKTRERLLRVADLTLQKTDDICHAAEGMVAQMKVVEEVSTNPTVQAVSSDKAAHRAPEQRQSRLQGGGADPRQKRECWYCGRQHDLPRHEHCPAFGKRCSKCHKMNHFAAKCCSNAPPSVCPVTSTEEQEEEIFQTHTPETKLDDPQLVMLQLDTGSLVRFQVDTGARCNVVPLSVYKRATNDQTLR